MKIGTKSVLFGVHAFWWHPITVARAWRRVHRRYPNWWELICIATHDLGYWGCSDMDGPEGKLHPIVGARLAYRITHFFCSSDSMIPAKAYWLCCYHSSSMAKMDKRQPSALYLPDKVSILFDPEWFYLLRARLTGEIDEYIANSPVSYSLDRDWYAWYCDAVENKLYQHEKNSTCSL